jgi:ribosomal protein L11 methyltransferase
MGNLFSAFCYVSNKTKGAPQMSQTIENAIIKVLSATERLTPAQIFSQLTYPRRVIMQTINRLVQNAHLIFTYELGTAFVRLSFNKPVRISERIVLVPPNRNIPKDLLSKVVIKISAGDAFGDGHHPTTSLIIELLDETLSKNSNITIKKGLDIGTGSGILAIAAAKLGVESVIATDIDPVAVYEAKINVALNQLTNRITLMKSDQIPVGTYQLIMANLRLPTLVNLAEKFNKIIDKQGFVICSGYTNEESNFLIIRFKQHNIECLHQIKHHKWAAGVFIRK